MTKAKGPSNERRTFLRQAASLAGTVPVGSRAFGAAGIAVVAATSANNAHAADTSSASAPFTGYQFLGPVEATFVEAMVNVMCPRRPAHTERRGLRARELHRPPAGGRLRSGRAALHARALETGQAAAGLPAAADARAVLQGGAGGRQRSLRAQVWQVVRPAPGCGRERVPARSAADKYTDPRVPLASWFNELVYPLFVQACFADPIYGGNHGKVFWKMIGYPGLPATHTLDMVQFRGKPYPGAKDPKSMVDFS